jgi:hypothetical protein
MLDKSGSPAPSLDSGTEMSCRMVGRFVGKEGCFALRDRAGAEVWLEMDRIPLHLLDEDVEITGRRYGASLIAVETFGPVRGLS